MLDLDGPVFNLRAKLAETYAVACDARSRVASYDLALVDLLQVAGKLGHRIACISSKRSDPIHCLETLQSLGLGPYLHEHWLVPHPGHEQPGLFKATWTENRAALVRKWAAATSTALQHIVAIDDQPEEYIEAGSTRITVIAAFNEDGVPARQLQRLVTFLHQ